MNLNKSGLHATSDSQLDDSAPSHLVEWFEANQRQLPWRKTRDPYKIWISETMLQQTRVETVIPYYHTFLEHFPTVTDLAAASEEEVLKLWQGLGYYSRARNLHRAAQQVVANFAGEVPKNLEDFRSLAGVGPYTAGAVQSIAFNAPVPAVDGNVLRVMARVLAISEEVRSRSATARITNQVTAWLEQESPRLLTQAVMELGALVCTPRNPKCLTCPIQKHCEAYAEGLTDVLPVRKQQAPRQLVQVVALWCQQGERVLLEQRADTGLLAGMWQLPAVEVKVEQAQMEKPSAERVAEGRVVGEPDHVLSDDGAWTSASVTTRTQMSSAAQLIDDVQVHQLARRAMLHLLGGDVDYSRLSEPQRDPERVAESPLREFRVVTQTKHIFTHIEWRVTVLQPVGWDLTAIADVPGRVWANEETLARVALPRVYDKLLSGFFHGGGDGLDV